MEFKFEKRVNEKVSPDLVWAKMKYCSYWPARVSKIFHVKVESEFFFIKVYLHVTDY